VLDASAARAVVPSIVAIYESTWPDRGDRFATQQLPMHLDRDNFALATAHRDGDLVGFAYGYTGHRGQYWSDVVASSMTPDAAATWVGAHFEFVELAVLGHARGCGVGRNLATTLLTARPESRRLLQVAADNVPARTLYSSLGFAEIGHLGQQLFLGAVDGGSR
jgi:ribosomal protein S18 acetylase RimI-like enzyme